MGDELSSGWPPAARWFGLDPGSERVRSVCAQEGRIALDVRGRAWLVIDGVSNGPYRSLSLLLECWGLREGDLTQR
jgi:hypothetical protein